MTLSISTNTVTEVAIALTHINFPRNALAKTILRIDTNFDIKTKFEIMEIRGGI
jgi:hypothetical protein